MVNWEECDKRAVCS